MKETGIAVIISMTRAQGRINVVYMINVPIEKYTCLVLIITVTEAKTRQMLFI